MAEKRMACWNCPRYDREERHCKDGKTNPKRKSDAVLVAELLGVRALCHYNPHRDAIALRTYEPKHPLAFAGNRKTRRARRSSITIEEIEGPE